MPTILTDYANTLPDPNFPATQLGSPGPGYANVTLEANQPVIYSNAAGSRRKGASVNQRGYWSLTLTYNKLPKPLFDVIYSFLLRKKQTMEAFYVNLPQYGNPNTTNKIFNFYDIPYNKIYVSDGSATPVLPEPGDMFSFIESGIYYGLFKILRVEDSTNYNLAREFPVGDERWTIWPTIPAVAFSRIPFPVSSAFITDNPTLFGRVEGNITYKVGDDNLYQISPIKIREAKQSV
jgi:hypothetical protein